MLNLDFSNGIRRKWKVVFVSCLIIVVGIYIISDFYQTERSNFENQPQINSVNNTISMEDEKLDVNVVNNQPINYDYETKVDEATLISVGGPYQITFDKNYLHYKPDSSFENDELIDIPLNSFEYDLLLSLIDVDNKSVVKWIKNSGIDYDSLDIKADDNIPWKLFSRYGYVITDKNGLVAMATSYHEGEFPLFDDADYVSKYNAISGNVIFYTVGLVNSFNVNSGVFKKIYSYIPTFEHDFPIVETSLDGRYILVKTGDSVEGDGSYDEGDMVLIDSVTGENNSLIKKTTLRPVGISMNNNVIFLRDSALNLNYIVKNDGSDYWDGQIHTIRSSDKYFQWSNFLSPNNRFLVFYESSSNALPYCNIGFYGVPEFVANEIIGFDSVTLQTKTYLSDEPFVAYAITKWSSDGAGFYYNKISYEIVDKKTEKESQCVDGSAKVEKDLFMQIPM